MRRFAFGPLVNPMRRGDIATVGGRVLEGPILLGDEFTSVDSPAGRQPCSLRVVGIRLYGVDVTEVEAPMTPQIEVSIDRGQPVLTEAATLIGLTDDDGLSPSVDDPIS